MVLIRILCLYIVTIVIFSCGKSTPDHKVMPERENSATPIDLGNASLTPLPTNPPSSPNLNGDPWLLPELPKYRPLTEAFVDVSQILNSKDTANTLLKLREIASPTEQYQANLLSLLQGATTIDLAHLKLLLEAHYFQYSVYEQMSEELKHLRRDPQLFTSHRARELSRNMELAEHLSGSFSTIANVGFEKVAAFTWEDTVATLSLVYPTGGTSPAFKKALTSIGSLNNDQKQILMILASDKREGEIAANLALDLFVATTDKSPESLQMLIDKLKWSARDLTLIGAIANFNTLSHENVLEFIKKAYTRQTEIAIKAFLKSTDKSHKKVLEIGTVLGNNSDRGLFFKAALPTYPTVTTAQLKELCGITPANCAELARIAAVKWDDPSAKNAADIAVLLYSGEKDEWLFLIEPKITTLTTAELLTILNAAYVKKFEISAKMFPKISDVNVANIIAVANELYSQHKDTWLLKSSASIASMSSKDLQAILNAAYVKKLELAKQNADHISDLTPKNAADLASLLYSGEKDEWLFIFESKISAITTTGLLTILDAAYVKKFEISAKIFPKISDVNVANIIAVANELYSQHKDTWLLKSSASIASMSSKDLQAILNAAYIKKLELAKQNADHISDLTPKNAADIASLLYSAEKDDWLSMVATKWSSLQTSELETLITATYVKKSNLVTLLLKRINDLTVSNSIRIAKRLTGEEIDTFLLAAVDLVTDLTLAKLENMGAAAYIKKEEIVKKGKKRVSG